MTDIDYKKIIDDGITAISKAEDVVQVEVDLAPAATLAQLNNCMAALCSAEYTIQSREKPVLVLQKTDAYGVVREYGKSAANNKPFIITSFRVLGSSIDNVVENGTVQPDYCEEGTEYDIENDKSPAEKVVAEKGGAMNWQDIKGILAAEDAKKQEQSTEYIKVRKGHKPKKKRK